MDKAQRNADVKASGAVELVAVYYEYSSLASDTSSSQASIGLPSTENTERQAGEEVSTAPTATGAPS